MPNRLLAYFAAAVAPAAASAFWLLRVPPLWLGIDSTSLVLWPTIITPHYPPLYPVVIYLFEKVFGIGPEMLKALLLTQHLFLILSIMYLASAFRVASRALILSIAATAGAYFGAFAHTIATQGFDAPLLALMVGVVLRYHIEGWRWTLLPVFMISAFGLALTRHADVVVAVMVPAYWAFRALFARLYEGRGSPLFSSRYLGNAVICGLGLAIVIVLIAPAQHLTCWIFGKDCPYSITGRAGCYRMSATYDLVPAGRRANWIAEKTSKLSPAEIFSYKAMAEAGGSCWIVPYNNIAKSFPDENPDMLMNSVFFAFLLRPDRFSIKEMLGELRAGLSLDPTRYFGYAPLAGLLQYSARTVATDNDGVHHETRERLGARGLVDGPDLATLAENPLVKAYAWCTYYLLNLVAAIGLLILIVFDRRPSFVALGISIATGCLTYLLSVVAVTVMVPVYGMPVTFLTYVWTGILACLLADTVSFRRKTLC